MNITDIGLEVVDWINVAEDEDWHWTIVNTVMKLRIPFLGIVSPRGYHLLKKDCAPCS
jgi:hypothetical protein